MSRNPTLKVLSTCDRHNVAALLMGGQACVLYGAAEFTRDTDFVVDADEANLSRLRSALDVLSAKTVDVPELAADVLRRGHACHFRSNLLSPRGWRIDIMSCMRGCDEFSELWKRRNRARIPGFGQVSVLGVEDLVRAKKTQRDRDWPMIARLVESDYIGCGSRPPRSRVGFWLLEARTADLLSVLVRRFRATAGNLASARPAIQAALDNDPDGVRAALIEEQAREQAADRAFWKPLRNELRNWRRQRRK